MPKSDPKTSAGARSERKAFRAYVRRRIKATTDDGESDCAGMLQDVLDWVLARQQRYDARRGGLGRT